jgi:serine phosphatase RsbU (regulator of sigma subunit)
MTTNTDKEPGFRETLKADMYDQGLFRNLLNDLKDIIDFYLAPSSKEMLKKMNPIKRAFFYVFWILKSMILKLTPVRRLLLLIGILFLVTANEITFGFKGSSVSSNWDQLGGAIMLLVLMLELKDKLLAKDELSAGRKIQEALMPEQNPYLEGWSVWLYSQPANEVCGDLVDFVKPDDERSLILMADVAGKGLNAALVTAKLQAIIRALAPDYTDTKLIAKVNNTFYRESLRNIFATLFYIECSKACSEIKIVNAGHLPAFILKKNEIRELSKGNTALGLMKNAEYKLHRETIETGEVLVVFSDGVTEARNRQGDFFGSDRLKSLLLNKKDMSVNNLGNKIIDEINNFSSDSRLSDDLSLIILKKM